MFDDHIDAVKKYGLLMSLLNDMLKDLNNKSVRQTASLFVPVTKRERKWTRYAMMLPWIIVIALASYLLLNIIQRTALTLHVSLPSKLAPIQHSSGKAISPTMPIERAEEPEAVFPMNEKTLNYTREDWYEENLNKALESIQEGNDQRAIDLLTLILTEFPTSIEARENLAILYLSNNDASNAYEVLDEGLRREPHNLHLIVIKARLLAEQGSNQAALSLLKKYNPDMNSNPDYYGLLAAIFETLGRTNEAGSLYKALVGIEPSNGQYWLGLGVVLEHKHMHQQAIEAYRRATESTNIQPTIRAYAENRLRTLQG